MNAMVYIGGHRADYDDWSVAGATGWSYSNVLPYFIKAENNERGDDQFHGNLGPLSVCEGRSKYPIAEAFFSAAKEGGHKLNPTSMVSSKTASATIRRRNATASAAVRRSLI